MKSFKNINIYKYIYIILICISLGETFWTIDPVTLKLFSNIDVGNTSIISTQVVRRDFVTNEVIVGKAVEEQFFCTGAIYNRQFSYLDGLITKGLNEIDYDGKDLIIIPAIFGSLTNDAIIGTKNEIYLNKQNRRVYQKFSGSDLDITDMERISYVIMEKPDFTDIYNFDHIYLLQFPFNKDFDYNSWVADINSEERVNISYRGWEMTINKLK